MKIKQPFAFLFFNTIFVVLFSLFYLLRQLLTWEFYVFWFLIYLELIQAASIQAEPKGKIHYKITYILLGIALSIMILFALVEYFAMRRPSSPLTAIGILLCFAALVIRYYSVKNLGAGFSEHIKVPKKLVISGLYRDVRHPIYTSSIFYSIGLPLVLNSYYALGASLLVIIFIWIRADLEEKTLCAELTGYKKYVEETKRFLPF